MKKLSILIVFISIIFFSCDKRQKYTFFFPEINAFSSENEKIVSENRVFPKELHQETFRVFVEELILGPQTPRLRPLFSLGTRVEFCFLSENENAPTLFIGLSKEALYQSGSATEIQAGIDLFQKNILENFKNIEKIVLFIDGSVVNEYQF